MDKLSSLFGLKSKGRKTASGDISHTPSHSDVGSSAAADSISNSTPGAKGRLPRTAGSWSDARGALQLQKLWSEFGILKTEEERVEYLADLLPLFCFMCPTCSEDAFTATFGDGKSLVTVVAKRFMQEVQKIAMVADASATDHTQMSLSTALSIFFRTPAAENFEVPVTQISPLGIELLEALQTLSRRSALVPYILDCGVLPATVKLLDLVSWHVTPLSKHPFPNGDTQILVPISDELLQLLFRDWEWTSRHEHALSLMVMLLSSVAMHNIGVQELRKLDVIVQALSWMTLSAVTVSGNNMAMQIVMRTFIPMKEVKERSQELLLALCSGARAELLTDHLHRKRIMNVVMSLIRAREVPTAVHSIPVTMSDRASDNELAITEEMSTVSNFFLVKDLEYLLEFIVTVLKESLRRTPILFRDFVTAGGYEAWLRVLVAHHVHMLPLADDTLNIIVSRYNGNQDDPDADLKPKARVSSIASKILDLVTELSFMGENPLDPPRDPHEDADMDFVTHSELSAMRVEGHAGTPSSAQRSTNTQYTAEASSAAEPSSPTTNAKRIRSIDAFMILVDLFIKATSGRVQEMLMERMLYVFAIHPMNYRVLHHTHPIATLLKSMVQSQAVQKEDEEEEPKSPGGGDAVTATALQQRSRAQMDIPPLYGTVQDGVLKLVEYVVTALSIVPFEELCAMATLVHSSSRAVRTRVLRTLVKLLSFDRTFQRVAAQTGIVAVLAQQFPTPSDSYATKYLSAYFDCLSLLLDSNQVTMREFRMQNGVTAMHHALCSTDTTYTLLVRGPILRIFQKLISQDAGQNDADVAMLVELLQTASVSVSDDAISLQVDLCDALRRLFQSSPRTRDIFRHQNGFTAVMSLLMRYAASDTVAEVGVDSAFRVLSSVMQTLSAALQSSIRNRVYFLSEIGIHALADAIRISGISKRQSTSVALVHLLFDIAGTFVPKPNGPFGHLANTVSQSKMGSRVTMDMLEKESPTLLWSARMMDTIVEAACSSNVSAALQTVKETFGTVVLVNYEFVLLLLDFLGDFVFLPRLQLYILCSLRFIAECSSRNIDTMCPSFNALPKNRISESPSVAPETNLANAGLFVNALDIATVILRAWPHALTDINHPLCTHFVALMSQCGAHRISAEGMFRLLRLLRPLPVPQPYVSSDALADLSAFAWNEMPFSLFPAELLMKNITSNPKEGPFRCPHLLCALREMLAHGRGTVPYVSLSPQSWMYVEDMSYEPTQSYAEVVASGQFSADTEDDWIMGEFPRGCNATCFSDAPFFECTSMDPYCSYTNLFSPQQSTAQSGPGEADEKSQNGEDVKVNIEGDRLHPPPSTPFMFPASQGYTFSCWVRPADVRSSCVLLQSFSDDKKFYLSLTIRDDGRLQVATSMAKKSSVIFTAPLFSFKDDGSLGITSRILSGDDDEWFHVVFTHQRHRIQTSVSSLYVNGVLLETQKIGYPSFAEKSQVRAYLGVVRPPMSSAAKKSVDDDDTVSVARPVPVFSHSLDPDLMQWHLGSTLLLQDVLSPQQVASLYFVGPRYAAYLQGRLFPEWDILQNDYLYPSVVSLLESATKTRSGAYEASSSAASPSLNTERKEFVFKDYVRDYATALQPFNLPAEKIAFAFSPTHSTLVACCGKDVGATTLQFVLDLLKTENHDLHAPVDVVKDGKDARHASSEAPVMSSVENASEMLAMYNLAASPGVQRPFARLDGAGCHIVNPRMFGTLLRAVNGIHVMLGLISYAHSADSLLLSCDILARALLASPRIVKEFDRLHGYEVVASVLRRKHAAEGIISTGVVDCLFSVVVQRFLSSSADLPDSFIIANTKALKSWFLDWTLWKHTSIAVQSSILSYLRKAVSTPQNAFFALNSMRLKKAKGTTYILRALQRDCDLSLAPAMADILRRILLGSGDTADIERVLGSIVDSMGKEDLLLFGSGYVLFKGDSSLLNDREDDDEGLVLGGEDFVVDVNEDVDEEESKVSEVSDSNLESSPKSQPASTAPDATEISPEEAINLQRDIAVRNVLLHLLLSLATLHTSLPANSFAEVAPVDAIASVLDVRTVGVLLGISHDTSRGMIRPQAVTALSQSLFIFFADDEAPSSDTFGPSNVHPVTVALVLRLVANLSLLRASSWGAKFKQAQGMDLIRRVCRGYANQPEVLDALLMWSVGIYSSVATLSLPLRRALGMGSVSTVATPEALSTVMWLLVRACVPDARELYRPVLVSRYFSSIPSWSDAVSSQMGDISDGTDGLFAAEARFSSWDGVRAGMLYDTEESLTIDGTLVQATVDVLQRWYEVSEAIRSELRREDSIDALFSLQVALGRGFITQRRQADPSTTMSQVKFVDEYLRTSMARQLMEFLCRISLETMESQIKGTAVLEYFVEIAPSLFLEQCSLALPPVSKRRQSRPPGPETLVDSVSMFITHFFLSLLSFARVAMLAPGSHGSQNISCEVLIRHLSPTADIGTRSHSSSVYGSRHLPRDSSFNALVAARLTAGPIPYPPCHSIDSLKLAVNLARCAAFVVEKKISGWVIDGAQEVMEFIIEFILAVEGLDVSAPSRSNPSVLPVLYRSLNRMYVHLLYCAATTQIPRPSPSVGAWTGAYASFAIHHVSTLPSAGISSTNLSEEVKEGSRSTASLTLDQIKRILALLITHASVVLSNHNSEDEAFLCVPYLLFPHLRHVEGVVRKLAAELLSLFYESRYAVIASALVYTSNAILSPNAATATAVAPMPADDGNSDAYVYPFTSPQAMLTLIIQSPYAQLLTAVADASASTSNNSSSGGPVVTIDLNTCPGGGGFERLRVRDFSNFLLWFADNERLIQAVMESSLERTYRLFASKYMDIPLRESLRSLEIKCTDFRKKTVKRLKTAMKALDVVLDKATKVRMSLCSEVSARMRKVDISDFHRYSVGRDFWEDRLVHVLWSERAVWGTIRCEDPMRVRTELDRWRLDFFEGPLRTRRKLMRQCDPPLAPALLGAASEADVRASQGGLNVQADSVQAELVAKAKAEESAIGMSGQPSTASLNSPSAAPVQQYDAINSSLIVESDPSHLQALHLRDSFELLKLSRFLHPSDSPMAAFNCARLMGLECCPALVVLTQNTFYLLDHVWIVQGHVRILSGSLDTAVVPPTNPRVVHGDVADQDASSAASDRGSQKDVVLPRFTLASHSAHVKPVIRSWALADIREMHKRTYLLQPTALEVFFTDGRNYMMVFSRWERNSLFTKLSSRASASPLLAQSLAASNDVLSAVEHYGDARRLKITQKWQRGEISNFQYLMFLNTLAGRTYNDLTQYPVFPWVLRDYSSAKLDLSDSRVYRDLSKPMGGQAPKRAAEFQARFDNWEDPMGEVPKFHYGTHYSSAAIVLYYLIRLEPFSTQNLRLQGGRFDHADRLFHSIAETWTSAAETNMSDVKELVPEFYFLPEFLENRNDYALGTKQTGQKLHDVVLPPWAGGDAKEFVRRHRQALESEYVSMHLHEWIDLIFGHKQQGEAAQESLNVYYYLTYEGAVQIDDIDDPVKREATIAQINNFGQTPRQLFKKPHPPRFSNAAPQSALPLSPASPVASPLTLASFSTPVGEQFSLLELYKVGALGTQSASSSESKRLALKEKRARVDATGSVLPDVDAEVTTVTSNTLQTTTNVAATPGGIVYTMTVTTIANSEYTEVVEETLDSADNAQWEFTPRPEVTAADADSSSPQVLNSAVQSSTVVVPTYLSSLAHMQILLRYAVYSHPEILEATRAFKLGTPNWLLSPGVAISQLRFLAQQSSLTGNFPSFISGIASALVSGIEDAVSGQWIQWGQANSKDSSTSSVAAASSAASLSIVGQSANSQTGNVSPPVSRSASPDASQLNNSTLDHDFEEVGSPVSNATGGSVGLASDVRSQPSSFTPAGGIVYNAAGMSGNSDRVAALCGPRVFLPPSCRKYLMWGFADKSLRCYSCDEKGDRPIGVYDALHDGMITCAYVSDDGKLLVLGGDDCVVSVWDLIKIKHGRRLELKARLCGHLRPVTCVTVSATFGIVVSGSQDGSAIVWDLNRHAFTRHLSGHDGTVQCIAVNDATGDVITAAGTQLRIYTINGDLLVQKVVSPRACDAIRSVALSYAPEWVEQNVVVTGHRDGSIRFWSCTFSNIVTTTTTVSVRNERNVASKQSEKLRQIVSEEPEIAAVENEPAVAESGTDLNLSDDTKDTASFAAKVVNIRTKQLVTNVTSTNVKQTQMIVSGKLVRDLTLRARKIGHHTAVTALSLSADQQRLLSGDAQGVVLSWELPQDGITDHWIRDNDVEACASCRSRFTALNRRHHCRNCGRVMCGNCSSYRIELPDLHHLKPVRVCKDCYEFQLNVKRRKDGYQ